jgi:excisionase family DNA binding protein
MTDAELPDAEAPRAKLPRRAWFIEEVAEQLGIKIKTVRWMLHNGKLGYFMAGRRYCIPDEELQDLLDGARQRGVEGRNTA